MTNEKIDFDELADYDSVREEYENGDSVFKVKKKIVKEYS